MAEWLACAGPPLRTVSTTTVDCGHVRIERDGRTMRIVLGSPTSCPYCGSRDVRPSTRPVAFWERLLLLRRHRCLSCWRRVVAFAPWLRVAH